MLFLSKTEAAQWREMGKEIVVGQLPPERFGGEIRANLLAAFRYHAAALLAGAGYGDAALDWLKKGVREEVHGQFSNAFLLAFLTRHEGRLKMPVVVFADPRPFLHFAGVPVIRDARRRFLKHCGDSMPKFDHPIRVMDIGCGDGSLTAAFLQHLQEAGKVGDIAEIFLVDSSRGMIELAERTVGKVFPPSIIRTANRRIEQVSDGVHSRYDIALSSLAYHHIPREAKLSNVRKLSPWIDHFVIFEVEADTDGPELHSPELAVAVYQCYGRLIDFVFAHDAPIEVVLPCVDFLLMTEAVSFLTQPRGARTDYHMLRTQWTDLFEQGLGPEFGLRCDTTCYADDYFNLFTMHYGRS